MYIGCAYQELVAASPLYLHNDSKRQRSVVTLVLLMWKLMMWLKQQTNDALAERFLEAVTAFNLFIFPSGGIRRAGRWEGRKGDFELSSESRQNIAMSTRPELKLEFS